MLTQPQILETDHTRVFSVVKLSQGVTFLSVTFKSAPSGVGIQQGRTIFPIRSRI